MFLCLKTTFTLLETIVLSYRFSRWAAIEMIIYKKA